MYRLVPSLVSQMGQAYPELGQAQSLISETLRLEEERFRQTLERGLKLLDDEVSHLPEGGNLPGAAAFKLYDTFGFPLDLTQDALREQGRAVDTDGFVAAMEAQKAKARAAWSGSGQATDATVWFDVADKHGTTDFLGYDTETAEGQITAVVLDGAIAENASKGDSVQIALNQTPFYAEAGGQVAAFGPPTRPRTLTYSFLLRPIGQSALDDPPAASRPLGAGHIGHLSPFDPQELGSSLTLWTQYL